MNFGKRSRKRRSEVLCDYPSALQLYKLPPREVISLQEFEEMAEKRLRRKSVNPLCGRLSAGVNDSTAGCGDQEGEDGP